MNSHLSDCRSEGESNRRNGKTTKLMKTANRKGQRSIRLSKAYRAIYIIDKSGKMEIVEIIEVNKHDY